MGLSKLTVWSLNVNGLNDDNAAVGGGLGKRSTLLHMFKNNSAPYKLPDIVCIQESHLDKEGLNTLKREWPGFASGTSTSSSSLGCCILLHPKFNPEVIKEINDKDGRFNLLILKLNGELFSIFNFYAPNCQGQKKKEFFTNLLTLALKLPNVAVCGDLNCIINPTLDNSKKDPNYNTSGRREWLEKMSASHVDAHRVRHPRGGGGILQVPQKRQRMDTHRPNLGPKRMGKLLVPRRFFGNRVVRPQSRHIDLDLQ